MREFTGWQYLLIDAANQYGLDKETFEKRIEWAETNLNELEALAVDKGEWKEKPLYLKAVMAIRKAQAGKPTGHLVGFDAVCSGLQIMSAVTGCKAGAAATGLIDPEVRADAYTLCTQLMQKRLPTLSVAHRADVKRAVMTSLYGSKMEPKTLFGEGTPELNAFYEAMYEMAPGACELLEDLLQSWNAYTLSHSWKLPDGGDVVVKVMDTVEKRIEVDELGHATFAYQYEENVGSKTGLSNAANVVHSLDSYVLRCLERRCNYNQEMVEDAYRLLLNEGLKRQFGNSKPLLSEVTKTSHFHYYVEQFNRSGMADVVILPHLTTSNLAYLSEVHLDKLTRIVGEMVQYKPFPIISIHDEFRCHANNMNYLRFQYASILADLAEANVLDDILSQLYGVPGHFEKKSSDLGRSIRKSNYALS